MEKDKLQLQSGANRPNSRKKDETDQIETLYIFWKVPEYDASIRLILVIYICTGSRIGHRGKIYVKEC